MRGNATVTMIFFRLCVFVTLFIASSALFFGGGGGGGGCGCGGCGGGGGGGCGVCRSGCRAKRDTSLLESHPSTELPCTQVAWKRLIERAVNGSSDHMEAESRIQRAMHERFEGEKFFVSCQHLDASNAPLRFVTSGNAYCGHGNAEAKIWCTLVAMYA